MTQQLPTHRLRLFVLGLSLFFSGVVAAQTTSTPAAPPGVSVVENKWLKVRKRDMSTPNILPPEVDENSGMVKPPNDNSNLRRTSGDLPVDVKQKARKDDEKLFYNYFYWIKINNSSPRKIRSIAYEYVFADPGSKIELKRYSLSTLMGIGSNQTKWVWSGPADNPPQMVSIAGLQKDKRSPFDERVEIKCLLFTDGTGWRAPDAQAATCDRLVKITLKNRRPDLTYIDPGSP